ncbi:hypothetical protein HXX76_016283 [Chlamydomonas incerta]|uniref:Uncharacterized protein n=1 Tax=Chlamydomonas incerta TaxID=51695 RepID=A0A835S7D0_CHLIN|nr:hypothetical protein HXX76_016283 [Chlamydomonas incerta]|eukprot:KAG2422093.1 hypothetical protein HXX76_016283 [Chlamydomonas incerta]
MWPVNDTGAPLQLSELNAARNHVYTDLLTGVVYYGVLTTPYGETLPYTDNKQELNLAVYECMRSALKRDPSLTFNPGCFQRGNTKSVFCIPGTSPHPTPDLDTAAAAPASSSRGGRRQHESPQEEAQQPAQVQEEPVNQLPEEQAVQQQGQTGQHLEQQQAGQQQEQAGQQAVQPAARSRRASRRGGSWGSHQRPGRRPVLSDESPANVNAAAVRKPVARGKAAVVEEDDEEGVAEDEEETEEEEASDSLSGSSSDEAAKSPSDSDDGGAAAPKALPVVPLGGRGRGRGRGRT